MFNYSWPLTAQLAMFAWPPVVFYYLLKRRKAFERTSFVMFTVAMLALPMNIQFDLPSIPPINKEGATLVAIFIYMLLRQRKRLRRAKPFRGIDLFLVMAIVTCIGTSLTNKDPLEYGSWFTTHIKGLTIRDSFSMAIRDAVDFGLAFIVGRALFRTTDDLEMILKVLVGAGLVYSLACLVEIRLSPQLHAWIYGYPPHYDFAQTVRWGGYRPMICMAHGLAVAMFMTAATLSAATLTRLKLRISRFKLTSKTCMLYLAIILIACKSTGAIIYALVFVPVAWRARPKTVTRVAFFVALFVTTYPTLRAFDIFPTKALVAQAKSTFGAERAQSMEFRFDNEDLLLNKAMQRQWFGWGGYGRGRLYDEEMGKEVTVADGMWIIRLSKRGIFGTVAYFGVLLVPVFAIRKRLRKIKGKRERQLVSGAALILSIYCLDMVPNASYSIIPFVLAGALWTISANMVKGIASRPAAPVPLPYPPGAVPHPSPVYPQTPYRQ